LEGSLELDLIDRSQASLIPLMLKSIQDQQEIIYNLEEKYRDLEERFEKLNQVKN